MKQEELLEMVNATINDNGKKGITGKALNLALVEIIKAMGNSSGGGLMIQYLPRFAFGNIVIDGVVQIPQDEYSLEEPTLEETVATLQSYVDNNIKVYNTLMECNRNHTPVPGPIYFDTTFFEWYYNGRPDSVRGGIAASWRIWGGEEAIEIGSFGDMNSSGDLIWELLWSDGLLGEPEGQPS